MKALLIIDMQNDFFPGGSLPVAHAHDIVPVINKLQQFYDFIVATKDWHPPDHGSFAATHGKQPGESIMLGGVNQILWPVHCVHDTWGAEFIQGLETNHIRKVFLKGTDPDIDSYSGFFDNNHRRTTGLAQFLRYNDVTDVDIVGLATDYCVKWTALDARTLGFDSTVIEDATRGVDLRPGDSQRTLEDLRTAGVRVISSRTTGLNRIAR